MLKAKKSKKPLIITLSVILGIIFIFAAYLGICCIIADSLIYHYVDINAETKYGTTYEVGGIIGKGLKYPFFGNPLTISEKSGKIITIFPFNAGEKNVPVYNAINDPIYIWIDYMKLRYKNNAAVDYTVETDNEQITVNFSGTLTEDGKTVPIEQKFAFGIENASPENLPVWLNREEVSEGFNEYLIYFLEDRTKAPEWFENEWLKKPFA